MPDVNEEMSAIADYAIKSARERFKLELDYSEQSITRLESILEKIYWGFSNRIESGGEGGLVFNTAIIWGSYLGEYMRLKWGGTWTLKGQDRILSIINIEFSPVNLVYQKITGRPNFSLEDYLNEAKRVIYRSAVNPQEAKYQPKKVERFTKEISIAPSKKPFRFEKRIFIPLSGVIAALLIIVVAIIAYKNIKAGSLTALVNDPNRINVTNPTETSIITPTPVLSSTPISTPTASPTFTQSPTITPLPTHTSTSTYTPTPTYTPTETMVPTSTPTVSPTSTTVRRTRTPTPTIEQEPPTEEPQPSPTNTSEPIPTVVIPPTPIPVVLDSCEVSPSTIPAGETVPLTFIAHFTAPGYGFTASIQAGYPGQGDCSGTDDNGDGTAECSGFSGMIPMATNIDVVFSSSVGDCVASYGSP